MTVQAKVRLLAAALCLMAGVSACSGARAAGGRESERGGSGGSADAAAVSAPAPEAVLAVRVALPDAVPEGARCEARVTVENLLDRPIVLLGMRSPQLADPAAGAGWRRAAAGAWTWDAAVGGYRLASLPSGAQPILTAGVLGPGRTAAARVSLRLMEPGIARLALGVEFVVPPVAAGPGAASGVFVAAEEHGSGRVFRPAGPAELAAAGALTDVEVLVGPGLPVASAHVTVDALVRPAPEPRAAAARRAGSEPERCLWSPWRRAWVFESGGAIRIVGAEAVSEYAGVGLELFELIEERPERVPFLAWTQVITASAAQEGLAEMMAKYGGTEQGVLRFDCPRDEALDAIRRLQEQGLVCRPAEFAGTRGVGVFPP